MTNLAFFMLKSKPSRKAAKTQRTRKEKNNIFLFGSLRTLATLRELFFFALVQ